MTPLRLALPFAAFALFAVAQAAMPTPTPASTASAARPLGVGVTAPEATLRAADGATVRLRETFAAKPTVLIFYRGSWCPYCNAHLAALGQVEADLLALGYQILAVSPDTAEGLRKSTEKNKLNYRLVSDRDMHASAAYGLAFRVPEATAASYTSKGVPLAPIAGGEGYWLPVPAVYLIGRDGVIRFAHTNPDIKARLAPADILAAARAGAK